MNILFILSYSPVPRIQRRIKSLENGNDIILIYWNRSGYTNKTMYSNWNCRIYEYLNFIKVGNPLSRIPQTISYIRHVFSITKNMQPNIVILQDLDMLLFFGFYFKIRGAKVIYEVRDLHPLQVGPYSKKSYKFLGCFLRSLESILLRSVDLMIITSRMFYHRYYINKISKNNVLYIPNCPDENVFSGYSEEKHNKLVIGFIGMIRYEKQICMLIDIAQKLDFVVYLAGEEKGNIIKDYIKNKKNVIYYGKYDYEKEISELYKKVDVVYSVYDSNDVNVQIALPNRLYEALYLGKPIIASKGTYLGEIIKNYNIGECVDSNDPSDLMNLVDFWIKNPCELAIIKESCIKNSNLASNNYYKSVFREKVAGLFIK